MSNIDDARFMAAVPSNGDQLAHDDIISSLNVRNTFFVIFPFMMITIFRYWMVAARSNPMAT